MFYFCPFTDNTSPLADLAVDLQNVVVILFCLCCGSEDISENGSGWLWIIRTACFPCLVLELRPRAGPVDVVPVRLNDNYRGPLWFVSPFQRAASNSLFPIVFLLPLSFSWQIIRYRPSGPQAISTGSHTNPVCPSLYLSLSLFPFTSSIQFIFRCRGQEVNWPQNYPCTLQHLDSRFHRISSADTSLEVRSLSHVCQA